MGRALPLLLLALLLTAPGCGDDDGESRPPRERADKPVEPPRGWRTVENAPAGFTLAVPRSWTARTKGEATLIRSRDRLLVLTVAADRGKAGRELAAAVYARQTLEALPEFEGSLSPASRRVRGSPYESARVEGRGSVRTSKRPQRITVVAYRRPQLVTYAAVAFRNPRFDPRFDEPAFSRMLRTLRARPPAP
jgi:hypothetical protein